MVNLPQETFCPHVWFSIRSDTHGRMRSCCSQRTEDSEYTGKTDYNTNTDSYADYMNSDYNRWLQSQLLLGYKPRECDQCWRNEAAGMPSPRTDGMGQLFKTKDINSSIAPLMLKRDILRTELLYADVKVGNTCNFACAMCSPMDSTQMYNIWIKTPDREFVQDEAQYYADYFRSARELAVSDDPKILQQVIDTPSVRSISFIGGETFLYKKTLARLQAMPVERKRKTTLKLITNGSKRIVDVVESLGEFKTISIQVSLEGTADTQDYIRKRSVWSTVEQHVLEYRDWCVKNTQCNFTVAHVVQALSLENMRDFYTWLEREGISVDPVVLDYPAHFSVNAVSPEFWSWCAREHPEYERILNRCTYAHDPKLAAKLARYLEWYEETHTLTLEKVMPRLWADLQGSLGADSLEHPGVASAASEAGHD